MAFGRRSCWLVLASLGLAETRAGGRHDKLQSAADSESGSASGPSSARRRSTAGCSSCSRQTPRTSRGFRSAKTPRHSRSSASTSTASRPDRRPSLMALRWAIRSRACARFPPASIGFRPCCTSTRRFIARSGPVGQAAHGPRRGAAVEQGARQPLQHSARDHHRSQRRIRLPAITRPARQGHPAASPSPPTTRFIKHERIESEKLTKFWGRPMHLGAHVLLPEGFRFSSARRGIPLVIFHGHFPQTFGGFREEPPDPNLKPEYSERFHLRGLQPHRSGAGPSVLQGVDRRRTIHGWSSSRFSMPTRFTTTRTR